MRCPYCSNEMEEGYIPSDRYSLKWVSSDEKSKSGFFSKKIKLHSILEDMSVDAFYCNSCKKIIIDLEK